MAWDNEWRWDLEGLQEPKMQVPLEETPGNGGNLSLWLWVMGLPRKERFPIPMKTSQSAEEGQGPRLSNKTRQVFSVAEINTMTVLVNCLLL